MICCFSDIMFRYIKIELVTGDGYFKSSNQILVQSNIPSNDLKKKLNA